MLRLFVWGWIALASVIVSASAADDPLKKLGSFSAFSSIDLKRLEAGEILGEPGSQMDFPNGISTETCFAVPISAAEAAARLQIWDPSLHGTLKTPEFHPISTSVTAAEFQTLRLDPANRIQRWLLEKSLSTTTAKSDLNLCREECLRLANLAKTNRRPEAVNSFWSGVLLERARQFQKNGFAGLPAYEAGSQNVSPQAHLRSLLSEREGICREFSPLLRDCGIFGTNRTTTLDPFHYWALYEANRHATLSLGAVYLRPDSDRFQLLDVQYYVNGTYYTSVTLYEVWPIQFGEQTAALIWRGDFFSAPRLAYTRGVERMAVASIILQELKTSIRNFQTEASKPIAESSASKNP